RKGAGAIDQQHVAIHRAEVVGLAELAVCDPDVRQELPAAQVDDAIAAITAVQQRNDLAPAEFREQLRERAVHRELGRHWFKYDRPEGNGSKMWRKSSMKRAAISGRV